MNTNWNGPIKNTRDDDDVTDDDVVSEPKCGGLDRTGADQDDNDVVAQPTSGAADRTGG